MNLKNRTQFLKIISILVIIFFSFSCKNHEEIKYYQISVTDPNGVTLPFTVNKDGLLAGFIDSVQYGLTFEDGPNSSVIAKMHRLDYVVNETAKVMVITNVISDVDTIQNQSSKKISGGNNRLFDINVTNVVFKKNDNGWNECGEAGACCSIGQDNKIICCGTCSPLPQSCSGCGLKNPFPSASSSLTLSIDNPDNEPSLNDVFRNYNTLTVKLK